jgi:hypothetical protein
VFASKGGSPTNPARAFADYEQKTPGIREIPVVVLEQTS